MTVEEADAIKVQLERMLVRVRAAKEILGTGGHDHAYRANKTLEPLLYELRALIETFDRAEET